MCKNCSDISWHRLNLNRSKTNCPKNLNSDGLIVREMGPWPECIFRSLLQFLVSTATNILLIKSNLKFEPRATAVSVAMSPRYLGSKYRSRLHPRSRKCAWYILRETGRVKSNCARPVSSASRAWRQRSWSCGVFKSWISDARCPFQWKWQVLHSYAISVLQQVGMFFDGIACLMKVWPFSSGSSLVSRWRDVADVNKYIRTDFRGVKPCRENNSWYIRSDYLVQQIFNQSPPASYFQQFTGSCFSLWITGNSLWHRD